MFSFLDQIIKDNSHVTCMIKKSLFKINFGSNRYCICFYCSMALEWINFKKIIFKFFICISIP